MCSESGLITTIIPTYKRPQKLRRALLSVLRQSYPHFQVCVYDNGSMDETEEVVRAIAATDSRVHYFCHDATMDAGENFQFGLSQVQSAYFSFLGDDDLLLPTFYEKTIEKLRKYPEALCCIGSAVDIREINGEVVDIPMRRWPDQEVLDPPEALFSVLKHYVNWCGTLFRREVVESVGNLDTSIKTFDFEYLVRLSSRFPIATSKESCALFVHHAQSYSGKKPPKLYWPGWKTLFETIQNRSLLTDQDKAKAKGLLEKKLYRRLLAGTLQHLKNGNIDVSKEIAAILKERFPSYVFSNQLLRKGIQYAEKCNSARFLFAYSIQAMETVRRKIASWTVSSSEASSWRKDL